jgi:cyanobactin maturation PatA/PatG family protease
LDNRAARFAASRLPAGGLVVPIFFDTGGNLACSQLDLARAILSAVENGAHVINISGGQFVGECAAEADLAAALAACEEQRVLVIAAAGNHGCDCSHVPACVRTVLAVGAVGRDGRPLAAGNWRPAYATHGVIAPGEAIIGAEPGGGIAARTGTSFATAIASGTAARMLAERRTSNGASDPLAVRAALAGTVIGGDRRDSQPRTPVTWRSSVHPNQTGNRGRAIMTLSDNEHSSGISDNKQSIPMPPNDERGRAIGPSEVSASDVTASCAGEQCGCGGAPKDCGCGCGGAKKAAASAPPLVYALGQIGYDFGSVARRDSIAQFNRGGGRKTTKRWLNICGAPAKRMSNGWSGC